MKDQGYLLQGNKTINANEIEVLAHVPTDSPWFLGHFPGEPILPGIALVNMVQQAIIRDAITKGEEITLGSLRRVRFTQPVRPGESLKLNVTSVEAGEETLFTFKVAREEDIVCSGLITAKKKKR